MRKKRIKQLWPRCQSEKPFLCSIETATNSFYVLLIFSFLQFSLFSFSPKATTEALFSVKPLAVLINLVIISFFHNIIRLVTKSGLIAFLMGFFFTGVFSFINHKKISTLGEVFTLYDFFSIFHMGLLMEYLHTFDSLIILFFLAILIFSIFFLQTKIRNYHVRTGSLSFGRSRRFYPFYKTLNKIDKVKTKWNFNIGFSSLLIVALAFNQELHLDSYLQRIGLANALWNPFVDYKTNGVILTNLLNLTNSIIVPPKEYTRDHVRSLLESPVNPTIKKEEEPVSVLIYMVESLWDPLWFPVQFNKDPIPTIHQLQSEGSQGALVVPGYGGGTSNTEFEVLTGLSMYFEPPGSIPFVQYVQKPIEGLPTFFKKRGYEVLAFHNYNPLYYKRYRAYPFLGFEKFFSLADLERHSLRRGYPTDDSLVGGLIEVITQLKSPFFIHAVTMESHGPYDRNAPDQKIHVIRSKLPQAIQNEIEIYSDSLWHADQSIDHLVQALKKIDQKIVLVIFGDHLPALSDHYGAYIASEILSSSDPEQWTPEDWLKARTTPLLIWKNFKQEHQQIRTLSSNCLGSEILKKTDFQLDAFFQFNSHFCNEMIVFSPNIIMDKEFRFLKLTQPSWDQMAPLFRHYREITYDRLDGQGYTF